MALRRSAVSDTALSSRWRTKSPAGFLHRCIRSGVEPTALFLLARWSSGLKALCTVQLNTEGVDHAVVAMASSDVAPCLNSIRPRPSATLPAAHGLKPFYIGSDLVLAMGPIPVQS